MRELTSSHGVVSTYGVGVRARVPARGGAVGIRGRLQVDGSRLIFEPRASETRSLVQNKRPDAVAVQDVDVPVDGANTTDRAVGVRAAIVERHFASVTLDGRKLLDHRVASPLASLEQDQKLGHLVPALVELADY